MAAMEPQNVKMVDMFCEDCGRETPAALRRIGDGTQKYFCTRCQVRAGDADGAVASGGAAVESSVGGSAPKHPAIRRSGSVLIS